MLYPINTLPKDIIPRCFMTLEMTASESGWKQLIHVKDNSNCRKLLLVLLLNPLAKIKWTGK